MPNDNTTRVAPCRLCGTAGYVEYLTEYQTGCSGTTRTEECSHCRGKGREPATLPDCGCEVCYADLDAEVASSHAELRATLSRPFSLAPTEADRAFYAAPT